MKLVTSGLVALALLAACSGGPAPIRWGTDTCEQCRMVLDDRRFGAELVVGGRTYAFDGVDELARYMAAHPGAGAPYAVAADSGAILPALGAVYLGSPDLHGPMGGQIVAFADRASAERYAAKARLTSLRWPTPAEALAPPVSLHR